MKKMTQKKLFFWWDSLNGVLLLAVVLFAGFLWRQKQNLEMKQVQKSTAEVESLPAFSESYEVTEENILIFPGPEAPEGVRRQHFDFVRSVAKSVEVVEIANCKATPSVVKISDEGLTVRIRNTDDRDHILLFGEDEQYPVAAGKTTEIQPRFAHGPGVYGFGCDQAGPSGVFFLIDPLVEKE